MNLTTEQLLDAVLALPDEDRFEIAEALLASLPPADQSNRRYRQSSRPEPISSELSDEETAKTVKDRPHYTLPAAALASWIESQPEQWWSVDGNPRLMSTVDFPCPGDELAPAIRKIGKDLLVYDRTPGSTAHGEVIAADRLDALADTNNRRHRRVFLFSWVDLDIDWLLLEDEPLV